MWYSRSLEFPFTHSFIHIFIQLIHSTHSLILSTSPIHFCSRNPPIHLLAGGCCKLLCHSLPCVRRGALLRRWVCQAEAGRGGSILTYLLHPGRPSPRAGDRRSGRHVGSGTLHPPFPLVQVTRPSGHSSQLTADRNDCCSLSSRVLRPTNYLVSSVEK